MLYKRGHSLILGNVYTVVLKYLPIYLILSHHRAAVVSSNPVDGAMYFQSVLL